MTSQEVEQRIAERKVAQERRCRMWIHGQQCNYDRMAHSNYCALHGRGRRSS